MVPVDGWDFQAMVDSASLFLADPFTRACFVLAITFALGELVLRMLLAFGKRTA